MDTQITTPCYVRIEDADKRKEICQQLERIGYEKFSQNKENWSVILVNKGYYIKHQENACIIDDVINCGTNIECFLALAGMRNDTDRNQWFKLKDDYSHLAKRFFLNIFLFPYDDFYIDARRFYRRATAQEIIEHFNNK